jgi:translation initiation factor 1
MKKDSRPNPSKNNHSTLVYSTGIGRIKPSKEKNNSLAANNSRDPNDGIVRIHRETKGRGGKGVSVIVGLNLKTAELELLAKKLKQLCGTGGTVKDGTIEIQGDQREKLKQALEKMDYVVKIAGG